MRALGAETGIEVEGYGPDSSMLDICARTFEYVCQLERSTSAAWG